MKNSSQVPSGWIVCVLQNCCTHPRAAQMVGLVEPGPHHFLKLFFKNSVLENNGDCGLQLSTKAIVTNTRWLINCADF